MHCPHENELQRSCWECYLVNATSGVLEIIYVLKIAKVNAGVPCLICRSSIYHQPVTKLHSLPLPLGIHDGP